MNCQQTFHMKSQSCQSEQFKIQDEQVYNIIINPPQNPPEFRFHFQQSHHVHNQLSKSQNLSQLNHKNKTFNSFMDFSDEQNQEDLFLIKNQLRKKSLSNAQQFLGKTLQTYDKAVSQYLQRSLNLQRNSNSNFSTVSVYQDLDLLNQDYNEVLNKYHKLQTETPQDFQKQDSIFYKFLEEITHLSYEKINLELIHIISQIHKFIIQNKNHLQSNHVNKFLTELTTDSFIKFINFQIVNDQQHKQKVDGFKSFFFDFLNKIYHIIRSIIEYEKNNDDINSNQHYQDVKSQIKRFMSKRDLWEEQQEELTFVHPNKKLKF